MLPTFDNPSLPNDPPPEAMTIRLAQGILRAALDCIVVIDHHSRIVEWNDAAERTFGYTRAEALGADMASLIIPAALRPSHHAGLAHYLQTGDGPILNRRIEVIAVRKDEVQIPVELAVVPIDEEPPRFAAYLRDISDRKEAEAALLKSEARQREFMRDMLSSVTGGKLNLCESSDELPERLPVFGEPIALSSSRLRVLRDRAVEAARLVGLDRDRNNDLLTAVGEASMNAVVHAGGGDAQVCVDTDTGCIQVWVMDSGKGIEINRLPNATLIPGYTTAGTLGHGFKMLLSAADRVWLLTGPTGTTVVVEQDRFAAPLEWLPKL